MLDNIYVSGSNFLMSKIEETVNGGLILPHGKALTDGTPYVRGTVVKVGPGKITASGVRCPPIIQVGDEVAIFGNDTFSIQIDGAMYIVTSEEMIIFGKTPVEKGPKYPGLEEFKTEAFKEIDECLRNLDLIRGSIPLSGNHQWDPNSLPTNPDKSSLKEGDA